MKLTQVVGVLPDCCMHVLHVFSWVHCTHLVHADGVVNDLQVQAAVQPLQQRGTRAFTKLRKLLLGNKNY